MADKEEMMAVGNPMTDEELDICKELGRLHTRIVHIMGDNYNPDRVEATLHIHTLQNMVMSQAARRVYPQHFRQLGEIH